MLQEGIRMGTFKIDHVQPSMIFDKGRNPVNGFIITGTIYPWDEYFEIRSSTLDKETVADQIEVLIQNREALEELGLPPERE